jgi:chemotaxis protein methyltransferase WspC
VRACVHFAWGNVLEESFVTEALESGRAPYDVVFCRNLLIYLTPVARAAVERSIDRLLKPDGVVVVGAAEPAMLRERWVADAGSSSFTLRRMTVSDPRAWSLPTHRRTTNRPPGRTKPPAAFADRRSPGGTGPKGLGVTRRSPSLPISDQAIPTTPPPATTPPLATTVESPPTATPDTARRELPGRLELERVLEQVNALANARRCSEAIALCEAQQRLIGPSADLFFLAGSVHQSCSSLALAEECFQKTLYLDANHEDALLALSLIADLRGDPKGADRYRQSACRVLQRKGER